MKKSILALVVAVLPLVSFAIPTPVDITISNNVQVIAVPKGGTLSDFGDGTVFSWLSSDITAYNTLTGFSLPAPTELPSGSPFVKISSGFSSSGANSITLNGTYDYIFLHWGGQGGGWGQAYYIGDLIGTFSFNPPPGGNPAVGGLSFYSLYGPTTVPDGGTTAILLGGALTVVGLIRRKLKA
jgi:hypothetical protein